MLKHIKIDKLQYCKPKRITLHKLYFYILHNEILIYKKVFDLAQ